MIRLRLAWMALGHRLAACVGALIALIALLAHVPLEHASLRGAAAWCAVLLAFRIGAWLVERTQVPAPETEAAPPAEPGTDPVP